MTPKQAALRCAEICREAFAASEWNADVRLGAISCCNSILAFAATLPDGGEVERLRAENDTLRGLLGNSAKDCVYCGLPAAEQAKCKHGFPGCGRADDQMLSRHFADAYRADCAEAKLTECEADARRYRWLREHKVVVDEAIDAATKEAK